MAFHCSLVWFDVERVLFCFTFPSDFISSFFFFIKLYSFPIDQKVKNPGQDKILYITNTMLLYPSYPGVGLEQSVLVSHPGAVGEACVSPPLMWLQWLYISFEPRLCCPVMLANGTLWAEGPEHSIPLQTRDDDGHSCLGDAEDVRL